MFVWHERQKKTKKKTIKSIRTYAQNVCSTRKLKSKARAPQRRCNAVSLDAASTRPRARATVVLACSRLTAANAGQRARGAADFSSHATDGKTRRATRRARAPLVTIAQFHRQRRRKQRRRFGRRRAADFKRKSERRLQRLHATLARHKLQTGGHFTKAASNARAAMAAATATTAATTTPTAVAASHSTLPRPSPSRYRASELCKRKRERRRRCAQTIVALVYAAKFIERLCRLFSCSFTESSSWSFMHKVQHASARASQLLACGDYYSLKWRVVGLQATATTDEHSRLLIRKRRCFAAVVHLEMAHANFYRTFSWRKQQQKAAAAAA